MTTPKRHYGNRRDEAVSEARRQNDLLHEQALDQAYRTLMESPEGRLVLQDLFFKTGYFRLSYTGNADTYFNEGQRAAGKYIHSRVMRACDQDPARYGKFIMQLELHNREDSNDL